MAVPGWLASLGLAMLMELLAQPCWLAKELHPGTARHGSTWIQAHYPASVEPATVAGSTWTQYRWSTGTTTVGL